MPCRSILSLTIHVLIFIFTAVLLYVVLYPSLYVSPLQYYITWFCICPYLYINFCIISCGNESVLVYISSVVRMYPLLCIYTALLSIMTCICPYLYMAVLCHVGLYLSLSISVLIRISTNV